MVKNGNQIKNKNGFLPPTKGLKGRPLGNGTSWFREWTWNPGKPMVWEPNK